jgi:hypothetical protein
MMADAARVRENVAFIIGGGISNLNRMPAQVPQAGGEILQANIVRFSLAFSLAFAKTEFGRKHEFEAKVCDPDGADLATAKGNTVLPAAPPTQGGAPGGIVIPAEITQVIAFDIQFDAKHPGPHSVNIFTNGQLAKQIGFNVL